MKEFNIEAAKKGAKVRLRDGSNARIVCFDRKDPVRPLVVLVQEQIAGIDGKQAKPQEVTRYYSVSGKCNPECPMYDLVMDTTKREGWIVILKDGEERGCAGIYDTFEEAQGYPPEIDRDEVVQVLKIEWEE